VTNSTLTSQRRRVQKLEAIRARKAQHVVLVFSGTPEADANADRLIEEGRSEAERLGKELQVIRVGWSQ
jgi:regulator of protease activity HflC (stomatin/prohibitin superfamily)